MSKYLKISPDELRKVLKERGYKFIASLPQVREEVYGKVYTIGKMVCTVRVYTSVVGEEIRDRGEDAIRVLVVGREGMGTDVKIVAVSRTKVVYRVEGWRRNLEKALDSFTDSLLAQCEKCQSPLSRNVKTKKMYCPFCQPYKVMKIFKSHRDYMR